MEPNFEFRSINLPPFDSCRMCRNSMNQGCIEVCAPNKDYSFFDLKRGMRIQDMPRFPINEWDEMPGKVKGKVVAVYLSKIVDELKGVVEEDRRLIPFRRGRPVNERFTYKSSTHGDDENDAHKLGK